MNQYELDRLAKLRLALFAALLVAPMGMQLDAAPSPSNAAPVEIVLVEAETVTASAVSQWKKEGFKAVAVALDERTGEADYRELSRRISEGGLDLYYWIEVARNPAMATAHPRWMAALGSHEDWQKNFPKFPEPGVGEVAKAFPWVPIGYREAFDAHLARIEQLLKRAPPGWRGLLLNDLQAGPSSCGCGNLLCRWAVDYHVRSTATKLAGDSVAARFVAEVRKRVGDKSVVPVWTTECENVDLPADKHQGRPGTGLCGTVGCATGACPEDFTRQWSALVSDHDGPLGLLALHTALQRTQTEFGGGPGWVTNAIGYLDQTVPAHGGNATRDRLWMVVEDSRAGEAATARRLAAQAGVGAVIVARAKIDQSYEPRMIPVK
ncbi:MAG TPA: hypothetical protein VFT34_11535 [Verrucomicrobiae bacterium]|nr:hypothetical protein [Verrucomicrobiae bacterium]